MVDTVLLSPVLPLKSIFFFCLVNNLQSPPCHTFKL